MAPLVTRSTAGVAEAAVLNSRIGRAARAPVDVLRKREATRAERVRVAGRAVAPRSARVSCGLHRRIDHLFEHRLARQADAAAADRAIAVQHDGGVQTETEPQGSWEDVRYRLLG